jgi:hypothetical protein
MTSREKKCRVPTNLQTLSSPPNRIMRTSRSGASSIPGSSTRVWRQHGTPTCVHAGRQSRGRERGRGGGRAYTGSELLSATGKSVRQKQRGKVHARPHGLFEEKKMMCVSFYRMQLLSQTFARAAGHVQSLLDLNCDLLDSAPVASSRRCS